MKNFSDYANYYNLLYGQKDYESEARYIESLVKRFEFKKSKTWLDIGCGTGRHVQFFSKFGYNVTGIDQSQEMIRIATNNQVPAEIIEANATNFNLNRKFDILTSLFHVASYQTSDHDIQSYIANFAKHLDQDGIFVFDIWYGPGVLFDPPSIRVKKFENEKLKITRISEPELLSLSNMVNVNFQIFIEDKQQNTIFEIKEIHKMRYFFHVEILKLLEANNLKLLLSEEWMTQRPLTEKSWYACFVGCRK